MASIVAMQGLALPTRVRVASRRAAAQVRIPVLGLQLVFRAAQCCAAPIVACRAPRTKRGAALRRCDAASLRASAAHGQPATSLNLSRSLLSARRR